MQKKNHSSQKGIRNFWVLIAIFLYIAFHLVWILIK